MEPTPQLPFVARIDDSYQPGDVIDVLGLAGFVAGTQPWARSIRLQRVRAGAHLLPDDVAPSRLAHGLGRTTQLAEGDGWTLRTVRFTDATAELTVTAATDELAQQVLARAVDGAVAPAPKPDEAVTIGFWHRTAHCGARRVERSVATLPWSAIRPNYTRSVAAAFDEIMALDPARLGGRLLLGAASTSCSTPTSCSATSPT
jgi:hypothetical protein